MANTLSKTGITTSQTILAGHVTQSVDALTGLSAYDIKISGSLILTGSVSSYNGFTGNLTGTASWASDAETAQTASYVASTTTVTGPSYPSGSPYIPTVGFKFVAGGNQTGAGSTAVVNINELAGKTYGQDFFITATSAGATAGSISIQTPVAAPAITFISQNPNTAFTYHILYY